MEAAQSIDRIYTIMARTSFQQAGGAFHVTG
jgi:hypothetical protein